MSDELFCSNPDCTLPKTRVCVEGFDNYKTCPNFGKNEFSQKSESPDVELPASKSLSSETRSNSEEASSTEEVNLHTGTVLDVSEAQEILRKEDTRVIAIVGPTSSGKTTLALSFYEKFLFGSVKSWSFAGSSTLLDFEERCFRSRSACGRIKPETRRTTLRDGLKFMHIRLCKKESQPISLLLSERAGEYFEKVRLAEEDISTLYELPCASNIIFLLDGAKVVEHTQRHSVTSYFTLLMKEIQESKILSSKQNIILLLSKYDLFSAYSEQEHKSLNNFIKQFEKDVKKIFPHNKITSLRVAARPEIVTSIYERDSDKVFDACLRERPSVVEATHYQNRSNRVFLRFLHGE